MSDLADFIARHALSVLSLVAFLWLLITALFWHFVHSHGTQWWSIAARLWNGFRANEFAKRLKGAPVFGPLLSRTLTAVRYLGLYAVCAFIVAATATAAFFELADEIGFDESLARFDAALARALGEHLSRDTLQLFSVITHLGDPDFLTVLCAAVSIVLLALRRWVLACAWVITTIGGGLLNVALKGLFERARPIHEHGLVTETSFSFPSGHAAGSMLVYSLLGYLIVRHTAPKWHLPVAVIMVSVIVFVGSSRVLLQVHYLSDVLAGYATAAAWCALCIAGLETVRWRQKVI